MALIKNPLKVWHTTQRFLDSGYFDPQWYSQKYGIPASLAVWHWITFGLRKGYDPSEKFSTSAYLQAYPDVKISGSNPLRHFLTDGQHEGRSPKPALTLNYSKWIEKHGVLADEERQDLLEQLEDSQTLPTFSIVVPVYNPRKQDLYACLQSVVEQSYPHWELCIVDDASTRSDVRALLEQFQQNEKHIHLKCLTLNQGICGATNEAIAMAQGDYLLFLDHDDVLAPDALLWFAEALQHHPGAILLYSDEDQISSEGQRYHPFFKPDWSPERLRRQNYINHATVCKRETALRHQGIREGFEGSQDYDFLLRVTETLRPDQIVHIPRICYSWRISQGIQNSFSQRRQFQCKENACRAVQEQLQRLHVSGTARIQHPDYLRVRYHLLEPPLVSLIIPTRDHLDLLSPCLEGLLQCTNYSPFEVIVVDNGSVEPETLSYLETVPSKHPEVRVIRDDGPFNFSRLNNKAVQQSKGSVLGLLNNDLQFIHNDWLEELVSLAVQPEIGAVGPKLLYPNDTIQHIGLVLGVGRLGVAGHSYRFQPANYYGRVGASNLIAHEVIGVTGACLMVKKPAWEEVGGLDENNLAVAFNDVDFCLKLHEAGYRNIVTPHSVAYHLESASRGPEVGERALLFAQEVEYMKQRWKHLLQCDPYYNVNLSLINEQHEISEAPRQ